MNHTPTSSTSTERPGTHQSAPVTSLEQHPPLPLRMRRRLDRRLSSLFKSFRYAFHGVWYFLRTQRNAQIHTLVAACALALAAVLGLARWEWLALVLIITLVLAAEAVNTAIEAAVDVATSSYDPLARVAKDVAAGAVLLCAIAAVIVGCLIFLPHLWPLLQKLRFALW